jgi:lysyl-tRNA synthetase, class II
VTTPGSQRSWVPRAAGIGCFCIGLLNIVSALTPDIEDRIVWLTTVIPGALTSAATAADMVAGILLVLLSRALHRRKRRAWRTVVGLLFLSVILHVAKGYGLAEAILGMLSLVAMIRFRTEFYAQGDPRTRWRAVGVFCTLSSASLILGGLLIVSQGRYVAGQPTLGQRLMHLLAGLIGVPGPLTFTSDRRSDLVQFSLLALGLVTVVTTTYLALRPAEPQPYLSNEDESRMRELLCSYGSRDSLGYFSLRRDKSVLWSPTGKACISYRVLSGVMLASGDPLGDPEAWPGAIAEFIDEAARHAWIPAVVGCSERGGQVWVRQTELVALELGDEAVVDVATFSLAGRSMRNVRQMVTRVERAGYTCRARRISDVPAAEVRELARLAASWRSTDTERGFSMALSRIGDPLDGDCVVVTAEREGTIRAFLHFVPWGNDGLSLDVMRRDRSADAGLNELLISRALSAAPSLGIARISLNFAAFRSALERGERLGAGPLVRAWRQVLLFLSRWFQIESLYRFNEKFGPCWEPRFLIYPQASALPRIAVAALEAEAFVNWPKVGRFFGQGQQRLGNPKSRVETPPSDPAAVASA